MKESKLCNKCKIEKSIIYFSKKNKLKDGTQRYQPICKECFNKNDMVRRLTDQYKEYKKEYGYYYHIRNKNKILEYKKEYHKKNKKEILKKKKEYRNKPENKERSINYIKNYIINNREKYYEYRRRNPHIISWRNILYRTLKYLGTEKEGDTKNMLGYSAIQLKHRIEKQFVKGMSWDNYGEWEIDHIKPLTSFNMGDDVSIINSLDNLQPLWKKDNISKYNHII